MTVDEKIVALEKAVGLLVYWRNGNGGIGAEERLQCLEETHRNCPSPRLDERLGVLEDEVEKKTHEWFIERMKEGGFMTEASVEELITKVVSRSKEKTAIDAVKAWAPIIVALVALVGTIVVPFITR